MLARSLILCCGNRSTKWSNLQEFFLTPSVIRSKPGSRNLHFDRGSENDTVFINKAEELVRARESGDRGRLSYILTEFSGWQCRNPRDKVYGLLGLVYESDRVGIDYQKSVEDIFVDVVQKVIEDETFIGLESHIEFAESLRVSLGVTDLDVGQLVQFKFHTHLKSGRGLNSSDKALGTSSKESGVEKHEASIPELTPPTLGRKSEDKGKEREVGPGTADDVSIEINRDPIIQRERLDRRQLEVLNIRLKKVRRAREVAV